MSTEEQDNIGFLMAHAEEISERNLDLYDDFMGRRGVETSRAWWKKRAQSAEYELQLIGLGKETSKMGNGIYVASKTIHGRRWREMRDMGIPIISTWIDECGPGQTSDWPDLWSRCIAESRSARCLLAYREPGETLKGGWVEVGSALGFGKPVFLVGDFSEFSIRHHPLVTLLKEDIETAFQTIMARWDQLTV